MGQVLAYQKLFFQDQPLPYLLFSFPLLDCKENLREMIRDFGRCQKPILLFALLKFED
jgi:hypothetical protein